MLLIPVTAVPSQTLVVTLAAQTAQISIRLLGDALYFTLDDVVTNRICRNRQRLLLDAKYRGFVGDFVFVDTQGDTDPAYTGLGSRYLLVYLGDGE